MTMTVGELAAVAGARLVGDGRAAISGVAVPGTAAPGDIVFVEREAGLAEALASGAGAGIAGEFAASVPTPKPLLISPHPRLSFARVAARLYPPLREAPGVHATAVVHSSAAIAPGVSIQPWAVVGERAAIGANSQVGPGVVIGAAARIGRDCDLKAHVVVYPGTVVGDRVIVHAGAVLGSDGFGYVRAEATGAYTKFPQVGRL